MSDLNNLPFREFCEKNMSSYDFNRLHEAAKETKKMITIMLNKPEKMTINVLNAVSKALKKDPLSLMNLFNCGLDGISAREYQKLNK